MQASKHPNASTPQIPREISRATWCDLLFRLGFHQVKLQRNIHYILSMMTGCGSLKRSTDTAKTTVLDTDMFGTWLHSCLCNVQQKKLIFDFIHGCNTRTTISFRKEKRILITGHNLLCQLTPDQTLSQSAIFAAKLIIWSSPVSDQHLDWPLLKAHQ